MPPAVGHYRPTISNPFNQYPQSHTAHQPSHYQPQHTNYNAQSFGGHPGFPSSQQNGQVNVFGSGLINGAVSGGFNSGGLSSAGGTGLASHEAQMRFAQGAAMQQQQQSQEASGMRSGGVSRIREVWVGNLNQEMDIIRGLVDKYPFVSMDTEFPGVVARPMGNFPSKADYHYQCLRCNVDMLKLIQLGITLWSEGGELPPANFETPLGRNPYANNLMMCPSTWTFNFKFSLEEDMYSDESIAMLKKAGVDFEKNAEMGIDPQLFGSLLTTSGLVTDENITWLSFHSGYDFGYLVKVMLPKAMPDGENEYLDLVRMWFPRIYDVKYLFRHAQRLAQRGTLNTQATNIINALGQKSGLQDIADELNCTREGRPHTAGSDAWLTGLVFWQIRQKVFDGQIPEELIGMIWGLSGVGPPASAASQAAAMAGHQTPNTNGASLYHTGMTPSTFRGDEPPTPQAANSGLVSTPNAHGAMGYQGGMSALTAGGAFSNFQGHPPAGKGSTARPTPRPASPSQTPFNPPFKPSPGINNYSQVSNIPTVNNTPTTQITPTFKNTPAVGSGQSPSGIAKQARDAKQFEQNSFTPTFRTSPCNNNFSPYNNLPTGLVNGNNTLPCAHPSRSHAGYLTPTRIPTGAMRLAQNYRAPSPEAPFAQQPNRGAPPPAPPFAHQNRGVSPPTALFAHQLQHINSPTHSSFSQQINGQHHANAAHGPYPQRQQPFVPPYGPANQTFNPHMPGPTHWPAAPPFPDWRQSLLHAPNVGYGRSHKGGFYGRNDGYNHGA